jgi:hypothetical protein
MTSVAALAPLAIPLPDPPAGEYFTPAQWETLLALMDTVIPSIRRTEDKPFQVTVSDTTYEAAVEHLKKNVVGAPDREALDRYLDERASEIPEFQDLLKRTLIHYARDDAKKALAGLLSALK